VVIHAEEGLGLLHRLTGVILEHHANITSVAIIDNRPLTPGSISKSSCPPSLRNLPPIGEASCGPQRRSGQEPGKIYGKRIIIMGGGAQVGQWRSARFPKRTATTSAESTFRWIRFRWWGSSRWQTQCAPWRDCPGQSTGAGRGSDGRQIEHAVREVRQTGLLVISLNMAGSVPDAADLVVSDPVQAGVMAVMAVAETAKFNVARLKRRIF